MIDTGDTVTKVSDPSFRGTVTQLPRSIGRKRPRALVTSLSGSEWVHIDDLRKVEPED